MTHLGFWVSVTGTALGLVACSASDTGLVTNPVNTTTGSAGTMGMTTGTPGAMAGTTNGGAASTSTGAAGTAAPPPMGGSSPTGTPMGGAAPTTTAGTSSGGSTMGPMGGMGALGGITPAAGMGPMGGSGPMAGTGGTDASGSGGESTGGTGTGDAGSGSGDVDDLNSGENTMGWIGCSMGENTAAGYRRIGGTRMWGGFNNGGAVVQNWTSSNSSSWQRFDGQVAMHGEPVAVWIMICIFAQAGATAQEVDAMIENAREHSAPGVVIYITGQPLYEQGHVCTLAGADGPESTDRLAQEAAERHDDVIYPGSLLLRNGEVSGDTCHANTQGEDALGEQAKAFWGQP